MNPSSFPSLSFEKELSGLAFVKEGIEVALNSLTITYQQVGGA